MDALKEAPTTRVLVKDGKWLVPVEQRPKNWQAILPENPTVKESLTVQPTPEPQPTLEAIAEATEARPAQPEKSVDLCGCGKPENHHGMCKVRAEKARLTRLANQQASVRRNDSWIDLKAGILESAKWFGADKSLIEAALVLACGMFTRDEPTLMSMTGLKVMRVRNLAEWCFRTGLWLDNGNVILGNLDEYGDLEFWLNAMCVNGELVLVKAGESGTYVHPNFAATATERR